MVIVPTDSMSPVISGGDIVLVEKTNLLGVLKEFNPEEVKSGDIIIYQDSGTSSSNTAESNSHGSAESTHTAQATEPSSSSHAASNASSSHESKTEIIHRVISVNEKNGKKFFIVKGDNNKDPDEFEVYPEQVVGKALTWGNSTMVIPKLGQLFSWIP
jgi:signal peptidase I